MTKLELIDRVYQRMQEKAVPLSIVCLNKPTVNTSVRLVLDTLVAQLAKGGRAEFRGLGSFNRVAQPARQARNPKTGEAVSVPAKHKVQFKAGRELCQLPDPNPHQPLAKV